MYADERGQGELYVLILESVFFIEYYTQKAHSVSRFSYPLATSRIEKLGRRLCMRDNPWTYVDVYIFYRV